MSKKNLKAKGLRVLPLLAALLAAAVVMSACSKQEQPQQTQTETQPTTQTTEPQETITGKLSIPVKEGLEILDMGSYTGIYMEDGSDELVTGVLMAKLVNNSAETVEYAKFTVTVGGKTAEFTLTTLKPGDVVILLEQNRMAFDHTLDYASAEVTCENLALFQEPISAQEDKLKIQILDGAINVKNISGQDIPGRIAIYYKNTADGMYYGGITYRIVLEEGLRADEIRQMVANHFSDTGSEIVFVTIAQ